MKILLDTHMLIWLHTNDPQLTEKARSILLDPLNTVYYSTINIWEIQIKHLKSPETFPYQPEVIMTLNQQANLRCVPLLPKHALALSSLNYPADCQIHKDPFDRILICQAKTENMLLMTHDSLIPNYGEPCVLPV